LEHGSQSQGAAHGRLKVLWEHWDEQVSSAHGTQGSLQSLLHLE
jgi:hypothetical protein